MKEITKGITKVVEVKSNVLAVFQEYYGSPRYSYLICVFGIYKYNIETQELTYLNGVSFDKEHFFIGILDINYLVNNNYLFAKYIWHIDIYDINQDLKLINKNSIYQYEIYILDNFCPILPIHKFICNYENDLFVGKVNGKYKLFKFKNMDFIPYHDFLIPNIDMKNLIKLKDNFYLITTKKKISLLKKINE